VPKRASVKGLGADIFFGGEQAPPSLDELDDEARISVTEQDQPATPAPIRPLHPADARQPARARASRLASEQASTLAAVSDETIDAIRRAVKVAGKEVSFVRLTAEEKAQLADIVYTYKRQGKKTTENEINRIAVNYMIADYKANGERSVLARVIAALLA
jgi:hypothetical protein